MTKDNLRNRTGSGTFKKVHWHKHAKEVVSFFPDKVRAEIGYLLYLLQIGKMLNQPQARPMPSVANGAFELRVRGRDGVYRVFYILKTETGILAFHAFQKKTQKTDKNDLRLGQQRLKELLGDLNGKDEEKN